MDAGQDRHRYNTTPGRQQRTHFLRGETSKISAIGSRANRRNANNTISDVPTSLVYFGINRGFPSRAAEAQGITRNMAAHARETTTSREDAQEGMDFAQAILEILYDLKPRANVTRNSGAIVCVGLACPIRASKLS